MAPWLDVLFTSACQQHTSGKICQCDDHAHSTWSFSPTRIPRNSCLRHAKSVMQEKDFSVRGPQMIFTATNQRNWFCETGEHWNACLQATFMPNPPLLRLNEYIYIKSVWTEITLLPCNMESFSELRLSGPVTDIKCTHEKKDHTNIIEMKGALCASVAYYISRRRQIFTVNLVNLSYAYRAKRPFIWAPCPWAKTYTGQS